MLYCLAFVCFSGSYFILNCIQLRVDCILCDEALNGYFSLFLPTPSLLLFLSFSLLLLFLSLYLFLPLPNSTPLPILLPFHIAHPGYLRNTTGCLIVAFEISTCCEQFIFVQHALRNIQTIHPRKTTKTSKWNFAINCICIALFTIYMILSVPASVFSVAKNV